MSLLSSRKGQTEPIAALVAVAAICIGIGLYAGYIGGVLPGTSDRAAEGPASEQIWKDAQEDGSYPGYDDDYELEDEVDVSSLPQGFNVYVEITAYHEDGKEVFAEEYFGKDGETIDDDHSELPPDDARAATRPVPVAIEPGNVKGGTLRVEVWS